MHFSCQEICSSQWRARILKHPELKVRVSQNAMRKQRIENSGKPSAASLGYVNRGLLPRLISAGQLWMLPRETSQSGMFVMSVICSINFSGHSIKQHSLTEYLSSEHLSVCY